MAKAVLLSLLGQRKIEDMIESIELCFKHACRIDGKKTIDFEKGLNVIIGPNGSGKSTLLESIYSCPDCLKKTNGSTQYHYFNGETMNPHRSGEKFKGIYGSIIKVRSMFSSHGETMRDVLRFMPIKEGDCFLLDEPEIGHDLEWVIKIKKGLNHLAKRKCQIIVASHHQVFWRDTNVIELKRNYLKRMIGIVNKL